MLFSVPRLSASQSALLFVCLIVPGGCSGGDKSALGNIPLSAAGHKPVVLSQAQSKLYKDGVNEIVSNPQTATFRGVKALELKGKPGVHVCGYVAHKNAGGENRELPFYVELRDENGAPLIHRGQVGDDETKRSKVKFVCRHHEDI